MEVIMAGAIPGAIVGIGNVMEGLLGQTMLSKAIQFANLVAKANSAAEQITAR